MSQPANIYCYHCGRQHPSSEMRQIETKGGKKWRCIKSIEATRINSAQRDAFGKSVTMTNKEMCIRDRIRVESGGMPGLPPLP